MFQFGRKAKLKKLLKSLHAEIAAETLKFSVVLSDQWGERNTGSKLSGAMLSLGALTFFVHALDRICFSLKSETLKETIFDNTALELSRLYGKLIEVGGTMLAERAERETLSFVNTRGAELSKAHGLIGNGPDDRNSAVWLAACMISEDVGLPKQIFLITLIQNELLRGFIKLKLAEQVKAIAAIAS